MNAPLQLNYDHISAAHKIRDVRKNTASTIAWDQFYFVGFKIAASGGDRYHHALILADDHEAFLDGIAGEYLKLLDHSWVKSVNAITVVFVQNLMAQNPALIETARNYKASFNRIKPLLSGRNQKAFTVIGITDQLRLCTLEVDSDNALKAIDEANEQVMYEFGHRFKPLLISQANPVMIEFCALLDATVETLKCLMGESTADRGYLH